MDQPLCSEAADRLQAKADFDADVTMRRADGLELRLPRFRRRLCAETDGFEVFRELLCEKIQDLLGGGQYQWKGAHNYIELSPYTLPVHVFRVRRIAA